MPRCYTPERDYVRDSRRRNMRQDSARWLCDYFRLRDIAVTRARDARSERR